LCSVHCVVFFLFGDSVPMVLMFVVFHLCFGLVSPFVVRRPSDFVVVASSCGFATGPVRAISSDGQGARSALGLGPLCRRSATLALCVPQIIWSRLSVISRLRLGRFYAGSCADNIGFGGEGIGHELWDRTDTRLVSEDLGFQDCPALAAVVVPALLRLFYSFPTLCLEYPIGHSFVIRGPVAVSCVVSLV